MILLVPWIREHDRAEPAYLDGEIIVAELAMLPEGVEIPVLSVTDRTFEWVLFRHVIQKILLAVEVVVIVIVIATQATLDGFAILNAARVVLNRQNEVQLLINVEVML